MQFEAEKGDEIEQQVHDDYINFGAGKSLSINNFEQRANSYFIDGDIILHKKSEICTIRQIKNATFKPVLWLARTITTKKSYLNSIPAIFDIPGGSFFKRTQNGYPCVRLRLQFRRG